MTTTLPDTTSREPTSPGAAAGWTEDPTAGSGPSVDLSGDEPWAEVRRTGSGAVFLVGDRAFKVRRPVDDGLLDLTSRSSRLEACRRELRLNRRAAPDVYLGLGSLEDPARGPEPAVVMRRMPAARRLARLVGTGAGRQDATEQHVRDVARAVAVFHGGARRHPSIWAAGSRDALVARWSEDLDRALSAPAHVVVDGAVVEEVARLALRFLAGRDELFEGRIEQNRVVDGHGDLSADAVFCLDDGPRLLGCLDLDATSRHADQLDDLCSLAMDLDRLGRADLAAVLVGHYVGLTGDPAPPALVHHYVAHRAFRRAGASTLAGAADAGAVATLAALALDHLRRGAVRLVLVGGPPATGKSTLARGIGDRTGLVVLRSDEVRRELDPAGASAAGQYSPAAVRRTYAELLRRAGVLLRQGRSVVLDASWSDPAERLLASELTAETSSDLVSVRCAVTPRAAGTRDGRFARWPGSYRVDTDGPPEQVLQEALELLGLPQRRPLLGAWPDVPGQGLVEVGPSLSSRS